PIIDITHADDLAEDLRRRDFTVNALASQLGPQGRLGDVRDETGGLEDLAGRRLRMTGEAALRDDPLRLLRAARLAVELGFTIEDETAAAVRRLAPHLASVAAERQRDELVRILATPVAARGLRLMDSLGLLEQMLPELAAGRGVEQPHQHHYWDVFEHSIETVAALDEFLPHKAASKAGSEGRSWFREAFQAELQRFGLDAYLEQRSGGHDRLVLLKLAGLLHDVSKPETKAVQPDGRIRFFGHAELGAAKAERICRRLRFGNRESRFISRLVEEHLRPMQLSQDGLPTRRAVYRFFRDLGDAAPACLLLSLADAAAARGPRLQPERWRGLVAYIGYVLEHGLTPEAPSERAPRLVDGTELMAALELQPGPEVGRLLAAIEEAQALGEVATKEEAIEYARRMAASPPAAAASRSRAGGKRVEGYR
ncbi:MAG TPA: HD domain-containing protein, partial [Dehalococcoidia bacterium]|nr:HD domain-containing protein [Dehalococcoidia bacterium]